MRKIKTLICLLLLCCMLSGSLPHAAAATYAALELNTAQSGSGYTVTVKLSGNKRPQMIEFCLEYDSSKLRLQSVKAGSVFSSANAPTYSTPKTGRVLFAWEALTGLKDGNLLVLSFTPKTGATGTADIYFNEDYNTVFMDGEMDDITVTLRRAEIDLDAWEEEQTDDDDDPVDPYNPYTPNEEDEPYETYAPYDPYATPMPEETPVPLSGDDGETYTMADMSIYVGQVCSTQEGFLFLSSDSSVVTIENGQLRGVNPGTATVTAYKKGAAVGSCTITVQQNPATEQETASSGSNTLKIVLWVGIALILGAVILIVVILIRRKRH